MRLTIKNILPFFAFYFYTRLISYSTG